MGTSVGQGSKLGFLTMSQQDQSQLRPGFDIEFKQCPECFLQSWRNEKCNFCETVSKSESTHQQTPQDDNKAQHHIPQDNFTAEQQHSTQARQLRSDPTPVRFSHGSQEGLVAQLREMGEAVPEKWTIPQLKARLAEIREDHKANPESTLKGKLQKLHQASRNKGVLMEHLKDMGVPVNPNRTIAQMVALGEEEIHALFEPEAGEFVGFGKFGDKTYQEVWDEHQSYVSWVITTNQESDSPHWRLRRLSQWCQMQKHQRALPDTAPSPSKKSGKAESSVGSFTVVSQKGYQEEKTSPTKSQMMQDLADLEQMRQVLQNKIQSVAAQEEALKVEKAEMSHTEGRHKNRKEM